MRSVFTLGFLLFSSTFLYGQEVAPTDTIVPGKGPPNKQVSEIKKEKAKQLSDSTGNEPKKSSLVDTTVQNKYGDLLNDDILYNRRYPLWKPLVQVTAANAFVWAFGRFVMNYDFSRVGPDTWKNNFKNGWEWDTDKFGINFIGHPYAGTLSFNAGRANGYNYLQSSAFAVAGSLMWEYLGENTRPSYNDIINTPVNGAFLGEVLYRISSNILDDRTRGIQRFSRELIAGLIDPMRGINRLLQGKTSRITNKEVYQKERFNISLFAGLHKINDETNHSFGSGPNNKMINIQLDYGNPFEKRSRKPFDFFKLRTEFSFGRGGKTLDNITGYGILFGKNVDHKKHSLLVGGFQYYDYWDNKTFELGTIAFGAGLFSKLWVSRTSDLYTNAHLALVPFAGNRARLGPDSSLSRDYDFGGGLEGKFESTINVGKFATASLVYYCYFIRTYVGLPGNNFKAILKPRIAVKVYKNLSVGFEHYVYFNDRYLKDYPVVRSLRTEQKIFLLLYLEDNQRRGRYN